MELSSPRPGAAPDIEAAWRAALDAMKGFLMDVLR
jgi:hypothetical protein